MASSSKCLGWVSKSTLKSQITWRAERIRATALGPGLQLDAKQQVTGVSSLQQCRVIMS
jgi:hypothetical protein